MRLSHKAMWIVTKLAMTAYNLPPITCIVEEDTLQLHSVKMQFQVHFSCFCAEFMPETSRRNFDISETHTR